MADRHIDHEDMTEDFQAATDTQAVSRHLQKRLPGENHANSQRAVQGDTAGFAHDE